MSKSSKSTAEKRSAAPVKVQLRGARTLPAAAPLHREKKHAQKKAGPEPERGRSETNSTDFIFYTNQTLTLVCVPSDAPVLFSLADTTDLTGVHPDMLRYYWRSGLIQVRPGEPESELFFDEDALHEIRRIEHYRRHLGIGRRAPVSYTHLRAHETGRNLVCRLL